MQRKFRLFLAIIFTIFLISCQSNNSNSGESETGKEIVEEENVNTETDNNTDTESKEEKELVGQDNEKADVEQEEQETESPPQYELTSNWSVKPLKEEVNEKVVLLTIDDAPDAYALDMAKTLKELDAEAIFFVNGHFLDTEEEKQILKEIHNMGFAIGNHTYNHQALSEVSEEKQKEEILSLNQLIEEIIGEKPKFFRAPHGDNTEYATKLVEQEGMLLMNWSFGYDWNQEYMTEEAVADIMVNTHLLGSGANLLMHDREWTAGALDEIVNGIREKGFEIVDPDLLKTP